MIKVMYAIQKIAVAVGFIGLAALSGCIEQNTGWIPTLIILVCGFGIAFIIEKIFYEIGEVK